LVAQAAMEPHHQLQEPQSPEAAVVVAEPMRQAATQEALVDQVVAAREAHQVLLELLAQPILVVVAAVETGMAL
jgi:hypothetical protein